jgi:hypothetical protein
VNESGWRYLQAHKSSFETIAMLALSMRVEVQKFVCVPALACLGMEHDWFMVFFATGLEMRSVSRQLLRLAVAINQLVKHCCLPMYVRLAFAGAGTMHQSADHYAAHSCRLQYSQCTVCMWGLLKMLVPTLFCKYYPPDRAASRCTQCWQHWWPLVAGYYILSQALLEDGTVQWQ